MEPDDPGGFAVLRWPEPDPPAEGSDPPAEGSAEAAVGALYRAQATGLIRLAYVMLGDQAAAEDVVQDAFCGLYRRWDRLNDPSGALPYVRSSVLNGCRTALRRRARGPVTVYQPPTGSAEAAVLSREERQQVMAAVRRLPDRQREAVVLRFYLDLPAPLASAAVVVALVAGSLALTGSWPRPNAGPAPDISAVPPYYVAIVTAKSGPDEDSFWGPVAEVRATATGAVLARIVPPRPYADFTGVTAAADHSTFVLAAQERFQPPASMQEIAREYPDGGYTPPARFFVLHIDSVNPVKVSFRALPESWIPATDTVHEMALSPDGTLLAADIGGVLIDTKLHVFNLATGTQRSWFISCSDCFPSGGGLGFGGVNQNALSWTADSRHVAFIGPGAGWAGAVRLLDVGAAVSNLVADSTIALPLPSSSNKEAELRGAIITPDGRTVLIVEELPSFNGHTTTVREQLASYSTATGRRTAVINNLPFMGEYEQVLYTSATGGTLVISYARPGLSGGVVRGNTYTSLPWNPLTIAAAW